MLGPEGLSCTLVLSWNLCPVQNKLSPGQILKRTLFKLCTTASSLSLSKCCQTLCSSKSDMQVYGHAYVEYKAVHGAPLINLSLEVYRSNNRVTLHEDFQKKTPYYLIVPMGKCGRVLSIITMPRDKYIYLSIYLFIYVQSVYIFYHTSMHAVHYHKPMPVPKSKFTSSNFSQTNISLPLPTFLNKSKKLRAQKN